MTKEQLKKVIADEYDEIVVDDQITQINTMEKPDYTPLEMRDDEVSISELIFQATEVPMGFRGRYAFLSNMAYAPFEMNGHWFLTAEHAFHFWKCKYREDAIRFEAGNPSSINDPYEAKKVGRKVVMRDNWKDIRIRVMEAIIEAKFTQNEYLASRLLATEGIDLCENNNWGDTFWGKCNGKGENHLGKILCKVRAKLAEQEA